MQQQTGHMSLRFSWGVISHDSDKLPYKREALDMVQVESWRSRLKLPQYVLLVWGDNKLPIDLSSSLSVHTMFIEIGGVA